jgi:hypothetical protein
MIQNCAGWEPPQTVGVGYMANGSRKSGIEGQVLRGEYTIVPDESAPLMVPGSQRKEVTVEPHEFTQVIFVFDTGIR